MENKEIARILLGNNDAKLFWEMVDRNSFNKEILASLIGEEKSYQALIRVFINNYKEFPKNPGKLIDEVFDEMNWVRWGVKLNKRKSNLFKMKIAQLARLMKNSNRFPDRYNIEIKYPRNFHNLKYLMDIGKKPFVRPKNIILSTIWFVITLPINFVISLIGMGLHILFRLPDLIAWKIKSDKIKSVYFSTKDAILYYPNKIKKYLQFTYLSNHINTNRGWELLKKAEDIGIIYLGNDWGCFTSLYWEKYFIAISIKILKGDIKDVLKWNSTWKRFNPENREFSDDVGVFLCGMANDQEIFIDSIIELDSILAAKCILVEQGSFSKELINKTYFELVKVMTEFDIGGEWQHRSYECATLAIALKRDVNFISELIDFYSITGNATYYFTDFGSVEVGKKIIGMINSFGDEGVLEMNKILADTDSKKKIETINKIIVKQI